MALSPEEMTDLFRAGIAAADPRDAVFGSLAQDPVHVPATGKLFLLGLGKAACTMTEAALSHLQPAAALVVTNYENARDVSGATVMPAGHPVPDENGLRAACALEALLAQATEMDRVLVLVSGGGSALLPAPVDGLSLSDKAEVSRLLLGAGLDIVQMNAVRQYLSRLKGGGLLRQAAPAPVTALILSDVIGDDLRAIASGPTVAPIMQRAEVIDMLRAQGLWDKLPLAARTALERAQNTPTLPQAENRLIGSNRLSLDAMAQAAPQSYIASDALVGDVAEAAERVVTLAQGKTPQLALFGGETTVILRGDGRGGRNQELALRVAMALQGQPHWRFLSGGTDGRDGPTDAAGAIVDGGTIDRIRAAGGDPERLLVNNDSHRALELAGDLLITGATGTNVADLQILSLGA